MRNRNVKMDVSNEIRKPRFQKSLPKCRKQVLVLRMGISSPFPCEINASSTDNICTSFFSAEFVNPPKTCIHYARAFCIYSLIMHVCTLKIRDTFIFWSTQNSVLNLHMEGLKLISQRYKASCCVDLKVHLILSIARQIKLQLKKTKTIVKKLKIKTKLNKKALILYKNVREEERTVEKI